MYYYHHTTLLNAFHVNVFSDLFSPVSLLNFFFSRDLLKFLSPLLKGCLLLTHLLPLDPSFVEGARWKFSHWNQNGPWTLSKVAEREVVRGKERQSLGSPAERGCDGCSEEFGKLWQRAFFLHDNGAAFIYKCENTIVLICILRSSLSSLSVIPLSAWMD